MTSASSRHKTVRSEQRSWYSGTMNCSGTHKIYTERSAVLRLRYQARAPPQSQSYKTPSLRRSTSRMAPYSGIRSEDCSFLGPVQHLKSGSIEWGFYRLGPLDAKANRSRSELMLIPGMGLTVASWGVHLLYALAQDRALIVPDNPGMGFSSDAGDSSASAEGAVHAYADFITKLELSRPDILGWSYGGSIGLMLALHHSSLVGRVVDVAGDFGGPGGDPGPHTQKALTGVVEDAAEVFFPDSASGTARAQHYIEGCKLMPHNPITPSTIDQQVQAATVFHQPGAGIKDRLGEIQNDVLSIHGSEDDFVPVSVADVIVNTLPRAFGLRLPGAKHGVLFQYQDFCLAAIDHFLKEGQ